MIKSLPSCSGSVTRFTNSVIGMPNLCQRSQSLWARRQGQNNSFKRLQCYLPDCRLLLFGCLGLPHAAQKPAHATSSPEHSVGGTKIDAMIKRGSERVKRGIFFPRYLVQGDAEVQQWDDVGLSWFLDCKVSKNEFYIGCCFSNPRRGRILQDIRNECLWTPSGGLTRRNLTSCQ